MTVADDKHNPLFFPIQIPKDFVPTDKDGDGVDRNWKGKACPGYQPPHRPRWGGGFTAQRAGGQHRAIDIMAAEGSPVVSCRAGVVELFWKWKNETRPGTGTSPKGGNYVRIRYDNGFLGYYAHMRDTPLVRPGQYVPAGTLLGFVGRSGNAVRTDKAGRKTGCPHLHYSLTDPLGRMVDPVPPLRPLYDAGGWQESNQLPQPLSKSSGVATP